MKAGWASTEKAIKIRILVGEAPTLNEKAPPVAMTWGAIGVVHIHLPA